MKTKMKSLQLLCALLLMSSFTLGATKKCARLEVLKDGVITAEENTVVTVPFRLDTTSCPTSDTTRVTISRLYRNRVTDYCKIYKANENCRITGTGCSCPDEKDLYHLTKTVNRNDSTTWWWSSDSLEENKNLKFDVKYPASITSLSLPGKLHDPGQGVDAVCIWENGNPPVTARMLDRHRETLNDSAESGEIRHTFSQVGCQDAGLIRCEAPGASHNKTTMLLVRCLPEFVDTPTVDEGGSLKVGVRSHTKTIQTCKLTRHHPHDAEPGKPIDCTGFLTGTPPDLTLTVQLDNVKKEEEGQWRLELTNDVGTGYMNFMRDGDPWYVEMTTLNTNTAPDTEDTAPTGVNFTIVISVAIVSIAVVALARIVIKSGDRTYGRRRRSDSENQIIPQPEPAVQAVQVIQQDDNVPGTQSSNETNYYWEVSDGSTLYSSDEQRIPAADPPRPCLWPALPASYFHPSVSRAVTEGADDTRNVAPLYENSQLRTVVAPDLLQNQHDPQPSTSREATEGEENGATPSYGSSEACLNGSRHAALPVDSLGACASRDDDEYTNCRSELVPVATSEISDDLLASVLSEVLQEEHDGINFPHLYENDLPRSVETPELPGDRPELMESDPAIFPLAGVSNVTGETGHEMTSPNMTEMTQIAHQVPICDTGQAEKRWIPCGSPNSSRRKVSTL